MRCLFPFLLACLPCLACAAAWAEPKPDAADLELLKQHQVDADAAGLIKYLRGLGGDEQRKQIKALILKLGSDQFEEREEAAKKLSGLALIATAELKEATRSNDAEVRTRATDLLRMAEPEGKSLFLAVLRVVKASRPAGAAPELLKLFPAFPDDFLRQSIKDALVASARPEDADLLRSALGAKEADVRAAALLAYGRILGIKAVPEAQQRLKDNDELVRMAAVRVLLPHEPRSCLEALVDLLDAKSLPVRGDADALLRALTGQSFDYEAYAEAQQRHPAVARWREWVRKNGATAKLLPLPAEPTAPRRVLLCLFNPYGIKEIDWSGKEIFSTKLVNTGCGCQILANGHRVFADWGSQELVELDATGKEVWRKPVAGTPNCVHRLANGHTLAGLFGERKVVELDRAGKVVWQADVNGQPTETHRLENGRTLVALYGSDSVVELDAKGKEVWKLENIPLPESARRLANGNTLIASSRGEVLEYDSTGKLVWSARDVPRAYDAALLPNGHVLVGYKKGLRELRRDGKVVRELAVGTVRRLALD